MDKRFRRLLSLALAVAMLVGMVPAATVSAWWEFDLDYSGYVIEHFPEFQREHPRLARKFADTIERTYSTCSWMPDDRFQDAISNAVDEFLGTAPKVDIY